MYKSASKFLQNGPGRDIPRKKPTLRSPSAGPTKDELWEFGSGSTQDAFLDQLRPVLKRMRGDTKLRPGQLAKLLNAEGWKTAHDRRWSERKVIILLKLMARQSARRKAARVLPAPAAKKPKVVTGKLEREPLTREEVARRLSALGRVKA